MQPWVILQFTILLLVANGTPIVVKDLLGDRLSHPLDGFLKRRLDPPTGPLRRREAETEIQESGRGQSLDSPCH